MDLTPFIEELDEEIARLTNARDELMRIGGQTKAPKKGTKKK